MQMQLVAYYFTFDFKQVIDVETDELYLRSFKQMILKQKIRTFNEFSKEVPNFHKVLETGIEYFH